MDLYNKLCEYKEQDIYPMHMPGHKRNHEFYMENPYGIDITEIDGFDNLHEAEDILLESMERTARLFKTNQSYYLVNGSTAGLLAAISACTKRGDRILIARNSHKAVYNAVYLKELKPVYLYPKIEADSGILCGISALDVENMLSSYSDIKLVVITSPNYEGVLSDIKSISDITHKYKIPLLVDEAHGAHLSFHKSFPKSAIEMGADIVIQSIHKTLPAFTQTALLHRNSEIVSDKELKRYLSIYQSSSPSYILMAGISQCMTFLESKGTKAFEAYVNKLELFYQQAETLKATRVWRPEKSKVCFAKDPSKLVIISNCKNLNGSRLHELLLNTYKIQVEMVSKDYVICMTSVGDLTEGFNRLINALKDIDEYLKEEDSYNQTDFKNKTQNDYCRVKESGNKNYHLIKHNNTMEFIKPSIVYSHYEAVNKLFESVLLFNSVDRIVAEYVYLYPPGIPILVPGERITKEILEQLLEYKNIGLALRGMEDSTANNIQVLIE